MMKSVILFIFLNKVKLPLRLEELPFTRGSQVQPWPFGL